MTTPDKSDLVVLPNNDTPDPANTKEFFEQIAARGERKALTKQERKALRDAAMAARDAIVTHPYLPYDPKVALHICDLIVEGNTLKAIERLPGMPTVPTILRWLAAHEDFLEAYYRAQHIRMEAMGEEILEIADDSTKDLVEKIGKDGRPYTVVDHEVVNRSRLRVETRRWLMSKSAPKRYGDQLNVEHGGQVRATLVIEN